VLNAVVLLYVESFAVCLKDEQRRQLTEEKELAELKARQRSLGNIRSVRR